MGGQPQQQGGGGPFAPAFGGFMNDQTAQIGLQFGQKAAMAGQEYMEQSVCHISHICSICDMVEGAY
jgi:hypothetical protein